MPICTQCHPVVSDLQRMHWFYRRIVLKDVPQDDDATDITVDGDDRSPPMRGRLA